MGKISPVAAKYIIHATIMIEGVVTRPDVVGAVFGQTEGLMPDALDLRKLQRSGRIGHIDVNLDDNRGKVSGVIEIPSSLENVESAIIGAALETIERIGPAASKLKVLLCLSKFNNNVSLISSTVTNPFSRPSETSSLISFSSTDE